jgi:teichuronic acid biosynthesis protein TuaE
MISETNPLKKVTMFVLLAGISVILMMSNIITSYKSLLIITIAMLLMLFVVKLVLKWNMNIEKLLLLATLGLGFFQSAFFSLKIGPISLFPFRILFIFLFILFFYRLVRQHIHFDGLTGQVNIQLGFLFFWLGYSMLSLIWANSISSAVNYIALLAIGIFLIYFTVLYFKSSNDYLYLFIIWISVLIILIVIGLWNHFTMNHLTSSYIYYAPERKQSIPTSVFYNQNDFASYLAISIFFLFAVFKFAKNYIIKTAFLFLMIISIYLIYVTDSRASLLAILFGFVVLFFLYLPRKIKKLVIILGVFGGLIASVLFLDRIMQIVNPANAPLQDDNSFSIRTNLIKNSIDFITDSIGFGVGAGNAEYHMLNLAIYPTQGVLNVHNWWLEILVNHGLVIFVGYIILYLTLTYNLYSIFKSTQSKINKMVSEALLGAFITFLIASISPSSVSNLNYHWILFAFAIGFIHVMKKEQT